MSSKYTKESIEKSSVKIDLANKALTEIILAIGNVESETVREVMRESRQDKVNEIHCLALEWEQLNRRLERELVEEAKEAKEQQAWSADADKLLSAIADKFTDAGIPFNFVAAGGSRCPKIEVALPAAATATLSVIKHFRSSGSYSRSSTYDGNQVVLGWSYALTEKDRAYKADLKLSKTNFKRIVDEIQRVINYRNAAIEVSQKQKQAHKSAEQMVAAALPPGFVAKAEEVRHASAYAYHGRQSDNGWTEKVVTITRTRDDVVLANVRVGDKGFWSVQFRVNVGKETGLDIIKLLS